MVGSALSAASGHSEQKADDEGDASRDEADVEAVSHAAVNENWHNKPVAEE